MSKTYEERLTDLQKKVLPVELPKYEFISGLGIHADTSEEQNLRLSVQYRGSDARLYEFSLSPGEAVILHWHLEDQLKRLRSWDNAEENVEKINEYLRENYGLDFPY